MHSQPDEPPACWCHLFPVSLTSLACCSWHFCGVAWPGLICSCVFPGTLGPLPCRLLYLQTARTRSPRRQLPAVVRMPMFTWRCTTRRQTPVVRHYSTIQSWTTSWVAGKSCNNGVIRYVHAQVFTVALKICAVALSKTIKYPLWLYIVLSFLLLSAKKNPQTKNRSEQSCVFLSYRWRTDIRYVKWQNPDC